MISLDDQLDILEKNKEEALDSICWMLVTSSTVKEIFDLARSRLTDGFHVYGEAMFDFDKEERRRNILEELADAVVYASSGIFE